MKFSNKVIVRRGKKWQMGVIKRKKFIPECILEGIGELTERYIPLAEYTKILGYDFTVKEIEKLRKKIGFTEIRVLDKECKINKGADDITDKAWNNYFWKHTNSLCNRCSKTCKQSSRTIITLCRNYDKIIN